MNDLVSVKPYLPEANKEIGYRHKPTDSVHGVTR